MIETFEHSTYFTNQNSIKVPEDVKKTIRKRYYKSLGTSVINRSMSPPSLKCPLPLLLIFMPI